MPRRTDSNKQPSYLAITVGVLLVVGGLYFLVNQTRASDITVNGRSISAGQLALGERVYNAQCAACHGPEGEGQPNWRTPNESGVLPAPPHDSSGHTWHHADDLLLQIIAEGGSMPNSAMPAYAGTLTEAERVAVLGYIKTFWNRRELEFQQQVTEQAR